jgi:hypothetical protein
LVKDFNVDPELADQAVRGAVDVVEVHGTVHGSEEGTIKPATTLRNKFGDLSQISTRGRERKAK